MTQQVKIALKIASVLLVWTFFPWYNGQVLYMEYSAKIQWQGGYGGVQRQEWKWEKRCKQNLKLICRGFIQELALICVPRPSCRRIWEMRASLKEGI